MPFNNPEMVISRLSDANASQIASEKRQAWKSAKGRFALFGVEACPDARVVFDDSNTVIVRDINASGPKEPYRRLYSNHHLPEIGTVTHYSASLTPPGERPRGCGGADACWGFRTGELHDLEDSRLQDFVKKIGHPDILIQSLISASQVAALTGKPTTAMYYDHDTCRVEPLGWFENGGETPHLPRGFQIHDIANGEYDPRRIYANGIPSFTGTLPLLAEEFIDRQNKLSDKFHAEIPNLAQKQAVQRPLWAVLSSSPLPLSIRYPGVFDKPGDAFVVTVPRQKAEDVTYITPKDRDIAFDQLAYAIIQANAHFEHADAPFSILDGLLVEFPSMQMTQDVVTELLNKRPWAGKWFGLPGKQIVMGEMTSGILHRTNSFPKID